MQRRIGTVDRGLPVVIGVVDVGDVDTIQTQAGEALLERAHHAVGRVIEDDPAVADVGVVGVVLAV